MKFWYTCLFPLSLWWRHRTLVCVLTESKFLFLYCPIRVHTWCMGNKGGNACALLCNSLYHGSELELSRYRSLCLSVSLSCVCFCKYSRLNMSWVFLRQCFWGAFASFQYVMWRVAHLRSMLSWEMLVPFSWIFRVQGFLLCGSMRTVGQLNLFGPRESFSAWLESKNKHHGDSHMEWPDSAWVTLLNPLWPSSLVPHPLPRRFGL